MLWFLLGTLALLTGSWLMAARMALKKTLDRWLAIGVLTMAGQVLILLLAGQALRHLNRGVVLLLALGLAGLGFLVRNRQGSRSGEIFSFESGATGDIGEPGNAEIFSSSLIAVTGVILAFSLAALVLGWIYLPPFAWDEIWYHLTPMAAWFKQGAITRLPEALLWQHYDPTRVTSRKLALDLSVAFNWANVYPLNAELNALWIMVLTGNDLLVDATQFPYVVIGALATFGLSRSGGAGRNASILASMLFLLTPMVLIHLRVAYVDAAFGSMIAAALYLFLRWQEERNLEYALILGLAIGLMMGIKATGIAFAGVFVLAIVASGFWQYRQGVSGNRALWLQITVILLALMATGTFWYLRTWWFYGNPVYPVEIQVLGWKLPGMGSVSRLFMTANTPEAYRGRNIILNILTSWLELGNESYNYYSRTRGLGPAWAALALPAILPFTFSAWRRRRAPVLWMVGLTLIFLILQPAAWWPRYVLYVVPVGLAAMAWVYDRLDPRLKTAVAGIMILNLVVATGLTLVETLDKLPAAMRLDPAHRTFGELYFSDYAWVDQLPPSRIGYTPMAWIYPLYGGLRNQVELVDGTTAESWREAIIRQGLDFVVTNTQYGDYDRWALSLPDLLTPYRKGEMINVYRVRPGRGRQ
ncbi:hypothetical protein MTAT_03040 [Moorella thermoacetica]|uniref:Glycosyltransferase RgtA/B/C/D-like domain-containing protein n=1 Tax=Neomoorella thermoacetica TaxID=1525 RepID=A0AAC9MVW7_NEOTH|nr:glycosyltransferase family 39 protein [Moorella thermoacetica]AOQ24887.1 hypothetical protein Maut_02467 [Moorella thermoacetica]TYL15571.1 hypothetical protein MTAT_03040 [Moorella thermoacetica]